MIKAISHSSISALTLSFSALFLASCSKSKPEPERADIAPAAPPIQHPKFDSVREFEAIVVNLKANLSSLRDDPRYEYHEEVSYDIKKTDSLLNPVIGVIRVQRTEKTRSIGEINIRGALKRDYEITLVPKDDAWLLQGLEFESTSFMIVNDKEAVRLTHGEGNASSKIRSNPGTKEWEEVEKWLFKKPSALTQPLH